MCLTLSQSSKGKMPWKGKHYYVEHCELVKQLALFCRSALERFSMIMLKCGYDQFIESGLLLDICFLLFRDLLDFCN